MRGGLLRNPWLVGGIAVSVLLQGPVLYAPPLNDLFHTVPLSVSSLWFVLALASTVLWVEEGRKLLMRAAARRRHAATSHGLA